MYLYRFAHFMFIKKCLHSDHKVQMAIMDKKLGSFIWKCMHTTYKMLVSPLQIECLYENAWDLMHLPRAHIHHAKTDGPISIGIRWTLGQKMALCTFLFTNG